MKDKSLELIFREKLEDLRIEPSDQAKDLIHQRIKKRGRIILYRRLSIAAGIILIMTVGLFYLLPREKTNPIANQLEMPEDKSGPVSPGDTPVRKEMPVTALSKGDTEMEVPRPRDAEKIEPADLTKEVRRDEEMNREKEPARGPQLVEGIDEKRGPADSYPAVAVEPQVLPENTSVPESDQLPGEDPVFLSDEVEESSAGKEEPVKITIEYIASGSKSRKPGTSKTQLGEFYSRMNKLVYPEEVLGDIRSLKDQLFALEFINRKSTNTQNNKEK